MTTTLATELGSIGDLPLERGGALRDARLAYVTYGALAPDGRNAVLLTHGFTSHHRFADPGASDGSWAPLVGPGRAIDTDRFFVVSSNMLGSSYGSTGPGSIDPSTGQAYGADFPHITMRDIVDLQKHVLDAIGVTRLAAVVGPSFGGYQAFHWATHYPGYVQRAVAAVSAPFHPATAGSADQVAGMLGADPGWRGGRYCDEPGSMLGALTRLRIDTLKRYGVDADIALRFADASEQVAELQRMALEWAREFDAGSLLVLMRAAEQFDVRAQLAEIRAPLLVVNSRTDPVFSPVLVREFGPLLDAAGVLWRYVELDSDKGHLASGADAHLWSDELARFMA